MGLSAPAGGQTTWNKARKTMHAEKYLIISISPLIYWFVNSSGRTPDEKLLSAFPHPPCQKALATRLTIPAAMISLGAEAKDDRKRVTVVADYRDFQT